jgi:hypothetical protein
MIAPGEKEFVGDLEDRVLEYFHLQRRFSTVAGRSVIWSLIDFPILVVNFPFIIAGLLFNILAAIFPATGRWKEKADWFRVRKGRAGWYARLFPPYRTGSARSKITDFKRMVITPLEKTYPLEVRTLDFDELEENLLETLSSWEKIPSLIENILAPFFWLAGISFLGLDPKTAIILSRNKDIYHHYVLHGRSWFGKTYLRIRWLFDDAIPWMYSAKFIVAGFVAYILFMVLIEFLSVQILYREGVEKRLLKRILPT